MTTTTSVTPTTGNNNGVLGTTNAKYDKNMFLELLTAQLKNQTPLSPVDDQSFMSQMASYSSIEQQQSLNKNLLQLLDYQGALARVQGLSEGTSLLGKEVTYADADGKTAHGTVDSVFIDEGGSVMLRLTGGKEIEMRSVLGITNPGSGAPTGGTGSSGSTGSGTTGSGSTGSGSSGTGSGGTGSTGTTGGVGAVTGTGAPTGSAQQISNSVTDTILEHFATANA